MRRLYATGLDVMGSTALVRRLDASRPPEPPPSRSVIGAAPAPEPEAKISPWAWAAVAAVGVVGIIGCVRVWNAD